MLRELIYVDTDKVRSLLAQHDGGVVEDSKSTEKKQGTLSGGMRNVASREQVWGTEESTQRSLADAVFPTLEEALTVEGYLSEVSEEIRDVTEESFDEFKDRYPPGSFVRITAPARLFDARYVANAFAGFAVAGQGASRLFVEEAGASGGAQPANKGKRGGPARSHTPKPDAPAPDTLESLIPDFEQTGFMADISASQFWAFVRVARGVFSPGLHIAMTPGGSSGVSVTARLQEGRRFLDSDPEILFSRYGLLEQEWTMVGTVGSYSPDPSESYDFSDIAKDGNAISRSGFAGSINNLLVQLGSTGLADQPQHPGLSIVPFAVYRPILPSLGRELKLL